MRFINSESLEDILVNAHAGVIRGIWEVPIDPDDPEIHVYSCRLADISKYNLWSGSEGSAGAGLSRYDARISAIGEGIERYCNSLIDKEKLISGSFHDLSKEYNVLQPEKLELFHEKQYKNLNYCQFTAEVKLKWVWGYSLINRRDILVPACLIYLPYYPEEGEGIIGPSISTGTACASSYHEAVLKGIYEVVERDAFTIMWLNRLFFPHVDILSNSDLMHIYKNKFEREHLKYVLINLTTDIGLPVIFSLIFNKHNNSPKISVGGAVNMSPKKAVLKALVEAAHTRIWGKHLLQQNPNRKFAKDFRDIKEFADHVHLYAEEDMLKAINFLMEPKSKVSFDEIPDQSAGDMAEDLEKAVKILKDKEFDIIIVDLTTRDVKEIGLRVVKVLIPGLQPLNGCFHERFLGVKRLYEFPRKAGYVKKKISIKDLNPFPHPYP